MKGIKISTVNVGLSCALCKKEMGYIMVQDIENAVKCCGAIMENIETNGGIIFCKDCTDNVLKAPASAVDWKDEWFKNKGIEK